MSANFATMELDFDDVLISPNRSFQISRRDVEIERDFQFYHSERQWKGCPVVVSPMPYLANLNLARETAEQKMMTCLHKFISNDELIDFFHDDWHEYVTFEDVFNHYWITIGITDQDLGKLSDLVDRFKDYGLPFPNVCVDAANGFSDFFVTQCAKVRSIVGYEPIIMAGNVCTGEMVTELIMYGLVDVVKVGIGPSKLCATRRVTGVGRPQLSTIIDCADKAHNLKKGPKRLGLICSDGGVNEYGDINKAFVAGADFVMCASLFNGVDECEGEWEYTPSVQWPLVYDMQGNVVKETYISANTDSPIPQKERLKVYGLSSYEAQHKHYGESKDYRASEGEAFWVNYKGPIRDIIKEVKGGMRSCGSYINAPSLRDFSKCGSFYIVSRQK